MNKKKIYYDCGICGHFHLWDFNGDCRDDKNRFSFQDIEDHDEIRSMEDRVRAYKEECEEFDYFVDESE